ncbi:hypothetical protein Mapa_014714 [Marchantia paleacea]|nr:hypothetical protein Mapa_014714 [Marchantia paleacea]
MQLGCLGFLEPFGCTCSAYAYFCSSLDWYRSMPIHLAYICHPQRNPPPSLAMATVAEGEYHVTLTLLQPTPTPTPIRNSVSHLVRPCAPYLPPGSALVPVGAEFPCRGRRGGKKALVPISIEWTFRETSLTVVRLLFPNELN